MALAADRAWIPGGGARTLAASILGGRGRVAPSTAVLSRHTLTHLRPGRGGCICRGHTPLLASHLWDGQRGGTGLGRCTDLLLGALASLVSGTGSESFGGCHRLHRDTKGSGRHHDAGV